MAEFSSLNGYQVKDTVARGIAKGRNQAVAFVNYETMIESLNGLEKDEYRAGQNIYIGVVGVPDLWVYGIEDIVHNFEYVSDEDIVEMLKNNTTIQVGYYKLAMLEGQKVDLTTYDQHLLKHDDDIAGINEDIAGINKSLSRKPIGFAEKVNLSTYTSENNRYTFEEDGVLLIRAHSESAVAYYLYGADGSNIDEFCQVVSATPSSVANLINVYKGFSVYVDKDRSESATYFYPYKYE